jgi:hypothetical protein
MKNFRTMTLLSLTTLSLFTIGAWATCSADVDMGNHKITNVAEPENAQDVVTKNYLDTELAKINPAPPVDRYSRDDIKNIVIDNTTGLTWQDNESLQKQWLTNDDYLDCETKVNNKDVDLSICENTPPKDETAQKYCFDLTLGGLTDWRLPTKDELVGILKTDVGEPMISSVFQYSESDEYWSSTSANSGYEYNALLVRFNHGDVLSGNKNAMSRYVRCVRDGL